MKEIAKVPQAQHNCTECEQMTKIQDLKTKKGAILGERRKNSPFLKTSLQPTK